MTKCSECNEILPWHNHHCPVVNQGVEEAKAEIIKIIHSYDILIDWASCSCFFLIGGRLGYVFHQLHRRII